MRTFPLQSLTIQEAVKLQFRLVDAVTRVFGGDEILSRGDLGLNAAAKRPMSTKKTEEVLRDFFGCEAAMLVRGAGTGALRLALFGLQLFI